AAVHSFFVGSGVGFHGGPSIRLHANASRTFTARETIYANASRTFTARERIWCRPPKTSSSLPGGLASRSHVVRSSASGVTRNPVKTSGRRDGARRTPRTASARGKQKTTQLVFS